MLRSLWLLFVFMSFLGLGITTPFIMTLGYVWVDTFRPQDVSPQIMGQIPVALIMGGGAIMAYFAMDRRSPPPLTLQSVLQIMMAIWMTATLFWAEVPERAWVKWDWAVKASLFAAFVPLVIRSRVQIEAFAQTYVFALAANFIPFGIKVMVSGGGYGRDLGLLGGNTGLGEGGYLSTACLMAVPLALYLGRFGILLPKIPMMPLAYLGVALLAILTALGTYERSAIIGLAILGVYMFMRSRRKLMFLLMAVPVGLVVAGVAIDSWSSRGQSMADYSTESSAVTRLLVWKWTLNYTLTHPAGGSFDSYAINTIVIAGDENNPNGSIQFGRAFHSIYFEMLGELGWPGLFMFLLTAVSSVFSLRRLSAKHRGNPELAWVVNMSDAVQAGMMVFLTAGAFVGLAFQPPFWYFVSMTVCLRAYVWNYERAQDAPLAAGWRAARVARAQVGEGWRKPSVPPSREVLAGAPAWRAPPPGPQPVAEPLAPSAGWRERGTIQTHRTMP